MVTLVSRKNGYQRFQRLTLKDPKLCGYQKSKFEFWLYLQKKENKNQWFLESSFSKNLFGDFTKLLIFTWNDGGYVTFGDNAKGEIIGIYGDVVVGLEQNLNDLELKDKSNEDNQTQSQHKEGDDLMEGL